MGRKRATRDIIGKFNAAVVEALADRMVQSRLVDRGVVIFPRDQQTPEALGARVKADATGFPHFFDLKRANHESAIF